MFPIGIILFVVVLAIMIRLIAGSMDGDRVERYIRDRGGRLISKQWNPLGRGWFGEKDSRIYNVHYVDAEGNEREATVKTSMMSGVYFTEDRIIRPMRRLDQTPVEPISELERLRAENARLREQLRNKDRDA
jgi:hypothetical protein